MQHPLDQVDTSDSEHGDLAVGAQLSWRATWGQLSEQAMQSAGANAQAPAAQPAAGLSPKPKPQPPSHTTTDHYLSDTLLVRSYEAKGLIKVQEFMVGRAVINQV